jgi:UDP-N-acetylmuramate dehydrogenase
MKELLQGISLKSYNTFGIEARARYFLPITQVWQLQEASQHPDLRQVPRLVLGGGSNVLFTEDFDGLILLMQLDGIEVLREEPTHCWLRAGAGINWHQLVLYTLEHNLGGLENLSLIPGTVGAAPIQNIGAYGMEVKDCIETVETLHQLTGQLRIFNVNECAFGYRDSIFKQDLKDQYYITAVTFRLEKNPHQFHTAYGDLEKTLREMSAYPPTLRQVSQAVIRIRQSKLPNPVQIGNAGSFFKNPEISRQQFELLRQSHPDIPGYAQGEQVKVPAGWLIEQCGWKGKRLGQAGVHERQALVLVNHGGATGKEIWELALQVQDSVLHAFGVMLSPEVNRIGRG